MMLVWHTHIYLAKTSNNKKQLIQVRWPQLKGAHDGNKIRIWSFVSFQIWPELREFAFGSEPYFTDVLALLTA